ncbi:50S ribosomal protein L6 [Candidatus Berkelbacteria bacterium CG_4_9_14_3_um_filter_39_23]|uniref:50S ribosomal protein L6 n=2 Tax=Candidatus Berkelbacteria TaxID=1618330 RepID=A0A2M7CJ68_9BACT|nr:50S ribosomal protein L6 [Candidatus Berkelbacteria bacterium]OIP06176.1 MAG: 50S ribosomal protein L6 [Candidatus Berkelbacteria bacterium CG2_30_39_44]PIR28100.1 MAG: 50S ribosomal protein L6 [Candidatus Berkelbacteria bacterium CG11_big_fil_rev_8_21_14_0_20_40_23]PIV25676.1 MAG: 50S ribosomal protein L6 [Candidatus Berkelbacteria bacterium CG03_land_8_20_14_0_80_40_36]PIZ28896.1 MAG: 50S ribosomal protein L6 [Candidatus Berkelbacteria bacterium CG_4_10_14_0_8_um_filter_39_42]PJB51511.1 M
MSRIGNKLISIPEETQVVKEGQMLAFTGKYGNTELAIPRFLNIKIKGKSIMVENKNDKSYYKAQHGLFRSLIQNCVTGVSDNFKKVLEIHGVGYSVKLENNQIIMLLGFSHPIILKIPDGLEAKIEKNTIAISGIDKQKVGQFSALIRQIKKPDPYKGKGIRYKGEKIRKKAGKAAKAIGGRQGAK